MMLTLMLCLLGVGNVGAVRLTVDLSKLPSSSENTTWSWNAETSTGTFTWTGTSYNSTELYGAADYSAYTTLHYTIEAGTSDHFRIIVKYSNGTAQTTYSASCGEKSLTWATIGVDNANLPFISTIRLSGANDNADKNVLVKSIYLEGPDPSTREVLALGSPITFEQALASSDPFVVVQNGKVLCGPLSSTDGSLTFKDVSEIENYSWTIQFEEDADNAGSYFMQLLDKNKVSKGYINGSVWSHTYLSGVDKNGTKGEQQDGALWTVTDLGNGKYSIRNLGVAEGNYNNKPGDGDGDRAAAGQGYLAITPTGYWADHVTFYNTSGEWQFYTLDVTTLPTNDHLYYGWDALTVTNDANVIVDEENRLVTDYRGYAPYWAETARWNLGSFDASDYRYMVFYAQRNVVQYGAVNGEGEKIETGGTLFIKDANGVTFRQDDFNKYNDVNYPNDHIGKLWMNRWNDQRATVFDLQWLANADKFGDGSECKVLDITKITEIGFAGTFTVGGIYFTNTLPQYSAGDYKRGFDSFDKFGTICLPYGAVCCGAKLYEIVDKSDKYISLAEHDGIMEPGKPYLYKTLEAAKQDGGIVDETNVYFFKAGYELVDAPVENNGLIGTFTATTAPQGSDYLVLSGNKLYNTEASTVNVGANKAYIDKSKIETKAAEARVMIALGFDEEETTGIQTVESVKMSEGNMIFNMNGQRMMKPAKGLNIIGGKKVMVK